MDLQKITACVLVKNESYYIQHVLSPLLKNLGGVLVFDTGSIDGTPDLAEEMGATVVRKGQSTDEQIGEYRNEMNESSKTEWTMIVDGDELYSDALLADIAKYEVYKGKCIGFTPMITVDFIGGQYVMMDDKFSRLALHPRTMRYEREYPFESPIGFKDSGNFFYIHTSLMAYHLHRLVRSPFDSQVRMRVDKQYLYSLQKVERPVIGPVELPLDPRYTDPYRENPNLSN